MPCNTWNTFNCKRSEAGEKNPFTPGKWNTLLQLASEAAQTSAANDAQPCVHRAKSRPPQEPKLPDVLEGRIGRRWQFLHSSSPSHTTYTNSLKSVCTFLTYAPSSFLRFFFSCISLCSCLLDLAVEVLNNRSRSSPVADSDLRACAHQISLPRSRFRYPTKFRYLSKPNFLRVNYP